MCVTLTLKMTRDGHKEGCNCHKCLDDRAGAIQVCRFCNWPVGFGVPVVNSKETNQYVHAECLIEHLTETTRLGHMQLAEAIKVKEKVSPVVQQPEALKEPRVIIEPQQPETTPVHEVNQVMQLVA